MQMTGTIAPATTQGKITRTARSTTVFGECTAREAEAVTPATRGGGCGLCDDSEEDLTITLGTMQGGRYGYRVG